MSSVSSSRWLYPAVLLVAVLVLAAGTPVAQTSRTASAAGVPASLTSPAPGLLSFDTSMILDASGNPVVSFQLVTFIDSDLAILHCNDPSCAGGDESITVPDTDGYIGEDSSIALDPSGNPVVSYRDRTNDDMRILHCNDPNCSGGDDTVTALDTGGIDGLGTSLAIDSAGNPVISYVEAVDEDLKLVHCNDPFCTGDDESIVTPDSLNRIAGRTSLALDNDGFPVVAYGDRTNNRLKILHCDDPNCVGGGEVVSSPDPGPGFGYASLVLDSDGYPVVAYLDGTTGDLKLLHCNDSDCQGSDDSVTTPSADNVGQYLSLALDAIGHPVVSHVGQDDLRILHCNDPNCAGVDDSITFPLVPANYFNTVLELDSVGNPLVLHTYGVTVRVLHCSDPLCSKGEPTPTPTTTPTPTVTPTATLTPRPPSPVGGISLDSELRPLPLETTNSARAGALRAVIVAAILGIAVAGAWCWSLRPA